MWRNCLDLCLFFSLPVSQSPSRPTLADALELYTKPETLSGDNKFVSIIKPVEDNLILLKHTFPNWHPTQVDSLSMIEIELNLFVYSVS